MCKFTQLILFSAVLMLTCPSKPFTQLQVLTDFPSWLQSVDISEENQILVAAHYDGTDVWIKNNHTFSHSQTISEDGEIVHNSDLTADGKMLVIAYWFTTNAKVYENINGKFKLFQTFSHNADSVAITDDHQWIALGSYSEIEIYQLNENKYMKDHVVSLPNGGLHQIAMSQDHSFLVVGTTGQYAYVYKHNGEKFQFTQRLTDTNTTNDQILVSITDDHQYLTVTDREKQKASLYSYNEKSGKFQPIKKNGVIKDQYIQYVSMSQNKQWICASSVLDTSIYVVEGGIKKIQTLGQGSMTNKFSRDGKYLFIGWTGKLQVYKQNSDSQEQNSDSQEQNSDLVYEVEPQMSYFISIILLTCFCLVCTLSIICLIRKIFKKQKHKKFVEEDLKSQNEYTMEMIVGNK